MVLFPFFRAPAFCPKSHCIDYTLSSGPLQRTKPVKNCGIFLTNSAAVQSLMRICTWGVSPETSRAPCMPPSQSSSRPPSGEAEGSNFSWARPLWIRTAQSPARAPSALMRERRIRVSTLSGKVPKRSVNSSYSSPYSSSPVISAMRLYMPMRSSSLPTKLLGTKASTGASTVHSISGAGALPRASSTAERMSLQ